MRGIRVSIVDLAGLVWRKSSRSGGGSGNNCVEVAFAGPAVAVRDSKNAEASALVIPAAHWRAFLAGL
jgi:Domain of unknown function (DUF397)